MLLEDSNDVDACILGSPGSLGSRCFNSVISHQNIGMFASLIGFVPLPLFSSYPLFLS